MAEILLNQKGVTFLYAFYAIEVLIVLIAKNLAGVTNRYSGAD